MATITARFPGTCGTCSQSIAVGAQIDYTRGQPVRHAACARQQVEAARQAVARELAAARQAATPATLAPVVQAAREVPAQGPAGLSVVAEGDARGYWVQIGGKQCSANALADALEAVGLGDHAPDPSRVTAFRRAVNQVAGAGRRIVRPGKDRGTYVVADSHATADANGDEHFRVVYRATLADLADGQEDRVNVIAPCVGLDNPRPVEVERIEETYRQLRADRYRAGAENTQWIRQMLMRDGATSTPHDATLFVRIEGKARLEAIRTAVQAAHAGWITVLPVRDLSTIVEEVLQGLADEAQAFIAYATENALGQDGTERKRAKRATDAAELKARIAEMERMFGRPLAKVQGELEALRVRLSGAMVVDDAVAAGSAPLTVESDGMTARFQGIVGEVERDQPTVPAAEMERKMSVDEQIARAFAPAPPKTPTTTARPTAQPAPEPKTDEDDGTANRFAALELD
jgi:hypothetical protein